VKLYWFWSTNPQKVRWALEELELEYERIEIDLFELANRAPSFLALNPRGTVPVLVDGDLVLCQSNAMLVHLGEREGRLWPADYEDRIRAHEWLAFEASDFQPHAGTLWFGETVRPRFGGTLSEEQKKRATSRLQTHCAHLDQHLAQSPHLLGEFSLVDCAMGIWLAALVPTSFDLEAYPNIQRYLSDLQRRPAYERSDIRYDR
jgi:glutathione S-transferase